MEFFYKSSTSVYFTCIRTKRWSITNGGERFAEEYLPGPGGRVKGSSYVDITATKNGMTLRVQTVTTLTDGVTPDLRETTNAIRIRYQTGGPRSPYSETINMNKNCIQLFASISDLKILLTEMNSKIEIQLYQALPLDEAIDPIEINNLELPAEKNIYLIALRKEKIQTRKLSQKAGRTQYSIDQSNNANSITLHAGGLLEDDSNRILLSSQIGTVSDTASSKLMYETIQKIIKKHCEKIQSYYVGKEAESYLHRGYRLTSNRKSSSEYDLQVNPTSQP